MIEKGWRVQNRMLSSTSMWNIVYVKYVFKDGASLKKVSIYIPSCKFSYTLCKYSIILR